MRETETEYADVVIVGAGPVGLLLACELSLAGVRPVVLERLPAPDTAPKARGLGVLAHEALRRRGFGPDLDRAHALGTGALAREHGTTRGHFAWIHKIDQELADPGRRGTLIAQPELERLLRDRATQSGVPVRYSSAVTALRRGEDALSADPVEVAVATPDGSRLITAAYVVGCDGGHSAVRRLAGFSFPGTGPLMTARYAHAEVLGRDPLPRPGRLPGGTLFHDKDMIATFDFADADYDRTAPLTPEEMRASVRRVAGADVELRDFQGGLRFTDRAAQAETYQQGRVLLAGDAAHIHSPNGGQGLNLGLMDAMNLGWKLAATVRDSGSGQLLLSYTAERHPVAAGVLHNTLAQSALLAPGPHTDALRDIMSDLMDLPEVNRHLSRLLSGIEHRYAMPYEHSHPLVGTHCPPLDAEGTQLQDAMRSGRPLLLHAAIYACAPEEGVERLEVTSFGRSDLAAVLLRPDGVIAWAASPTGTSNEAGLHEALKHWWPARL